MNTNNQVPVDLRITALDGRNYHKISVLSDFFSERALNSERMVIEIRYLIFLSQQKIIRPLSVSEKQILAKFSKLTTDDYQNLKTIENMCNHDVKSVEIYIQEKLEKTSMKDLKAMVHFGLTSDDINSCAYARLINRCLDKVIIPILNEIYTELKNQSLKYKNIPILGRTHGQPANGTTYGKELAVFTYRFKKQIFSLSKKRVSAKFSGNIGNLNAQTFVISDFDWIRLTENFLSGLDLEPEPLSTQIAPYDSLIEIFQKLQNINGILLGLSKDLWLYAMMGLLEQKVISSEVGSSALPHKINPIYLEGAEGGFEIANSLLSFYINKLSYSRLQRDLSDSTVRRSFGIAFSYTLLSYQSILEGLKRLTPNTQKMSEELESHPEILSEGIQNYLRFKGYPNAYDLTKKFFRGYKRSLNEIYNFIDSLEINDKDRANLKKLTPKGYTGCAQKLVEKYV